MIEIDTIANALDALYDEFGTAPEGEDHMLIWHEVFVEQHAGLADYWHDINAAREAEGSLAWDGLLMEATSAALSKTDPDERIDALLLVAATALTYSASVRRQTDALNAEESKPTKGKGGE